MPQNFDIIINTIVSKIFTSSDNKLKEAQSPLSSVDDVTFAETFPEVAQLVKDIFNKNIVNSTTDIINYLCEVVETVSKNPQLYKCQIDADAYENFKNHYIKNGTFNETAQQQTSNNNNALLTSNNNLLLTSNVQDVDAVVHESFRRNKLLDKILNEGDVALIPQGQRSIVPQQQQQNQVAQFDFMGFLEDALKEFYKIFKKSDQNNDDDLNEEKSAYLIWPANPPFFTDVTMANIKYAESLIGKEVSQSNVFIYLPRSGGDGDFSASCLDIYTHSKLGLSSKLRSKTSFSGITNIKTFMLQIKNQKTTSTNNITESLHSNNNNNGNNNIIKSSSNTIMTTREKMLTRLFEEEGVSNVSSNSGSGVGRNSSLKTTAFTSEKQLTIYCTPRVKKDFLQFKDAFKKDLGVELIFPDNPMKDDNKALNGGKQVYKDILSFINGEKVGSAGAEDTKVAMKSASSLKEADSKNTNTNVEANDDSGNDKPDSSKGKWDWSYIKTNKAAKEVVQKIFADVELLKRGFDDGGNPSKMFVTAKSIAAEYAKKWAAAFTDGADLMMEGFGLGWMMPLIKKGLEKHRDAQEEYQGIEAFIRSNKSNTLLSLLEDPDFYIEYGSNTASSSH